MILQRTEKEKRDEKSQIVVANEYFMQLVSIRKIDIEDRIEMKLKKATSPLKVGFIQKIQDVLIIVYGIILRIMPHNIFIFLDLI